VSAPALDFSAPALAPRIAVFLERCWGLPVELSGWRRFPAGFSWITVGFTAQQEGGAARELILRIGDPRGLLAPYRAEPEFRAMELLQGIPSLPVPPVHAFSDDADVIGAPFLITGRVQGDTPMPWRGDADQRPPEHVASLSDDFSDALAALHRVDWAGSRLGRLWGAVDPASVAREQVRYWSAHAGVGASPVPPQLHYAMRWLERHAPPARQVRIVHGDFRVGNFLQHEGRITAILDWELVHPGDPHEDLAWAGLRIFSAGSPRIGGLVERERFFRRYAERAGYEPDPVVIRYYEVLGLFKSAAMLLGALRRIESGRARDVRMASMGFQVASTLLELNRLIAEAG
jgi:aminoglycoside phosphotransferase (APT) family kinase protein